MTTACAKAMVQVLAQFKDYATLDTFSARVYQVGAAPDADGDVILADASGSRVMVSVDAHDLMLDASLEPAGEAVLEREGDAIVARGKIYDSPRGRLLQQRLVKTREAQEWSLGFVVRRSRAPLPAELQRYPDTKRVVLAWDVVEVSPVNRGACGPHCRTLGKSHGVKCAGACQCRIAPATVLPPDFEELARECRERQVALETERPPGVKEVSAIYVEEDEFLCKAAAAAARDLGLSVVPRVRYFTEPGGLNGFVSRAVSPNTIWIRVKDGRGPHDRLRTLGHEAQHLRDGERGEPSSEAAARRYGEKLRRSDPLWWPSVQAPLYDEHGMRI